MKSRKILQGTVIGVSVKPNSGQFHIAIEDGETVVYCREAPVKGRVNRELVKELSRFFKRRVEIVSGFRSRQKKVLIADTDVGEVERILSTCKLE